MLPRVIRYSDDMSVVQPEDLAAFFAGWQVMPRPDERVAALSGSDRVALAFDGDQLVGFAAVITDGALFAHVTLLEVLEQYRGRGIGSELMSQLMSGLSDLYGIDLLCDEEIVPFYERLGFAKITGMAVRRPANLREGRAPGVEPEGR